MNNSNTVKFDLSNSESNKAFAMLCRNLNEVGVPYKVLTDLLNVEVEISDGF